MQKTQTDQQTDSTSTAGVAGRPILLFPAAILTGLILDRVLPLPFAIASLGTAHWVASTVLILCGLVLFAAGVRNFSRAETPVPTNQPARVLVTTGIHGWTRNPIYLGFFLTYAGIGSGLQSPWMLILTLPLVLTIRYGVVAREEAYLERRFGDAYRDYQSRVRRWI
jgi:protein-S-isoprenylcysteine O-methyltransferase Ste14